jgi:hypothetical protein
VRARAIAPISVTERRTLRISTPRARRSATARDAVCSSGRKMTIAATKIAAQRMAIWP